MSLLFRYLFKKLCIIVLALTIILICAVWLTQSLRFIEVIVNHNVSLAGYFSLIIYLIPDLMATILPICLLIGGLHVYSKLTTDHEIHVMKAVGLSHIQIAMPLLVLSIFATALVFFINIYIMPLSFQQFRNQEHQIRNQFSSSLIREGAFNLIRGVTVYVRERGRHGELKGILIQHPASTETQNAESKNPYTVIAESGSIHQTPEGGAILILKKGTRQEKEGISGKLSFFSFEEFIFDLAKMIKKENPRLAKPYEKGLLELFHPDPIENQSMQARMKAEGHQRLLIPWLAIIDSLIVCLCMLKGDFSRGSRRYKILAGISCTFLMHIALHTFLNLSIKYSYFIIASYILVGTMIPLLLAALEWEKISCGTFFKFFQNKKS